MFSVLLWLLLFVLCWPLALLALLLWPLIWLLTIPFRILGIGVEAVFESPAKYDAAVKADIVILDRFAPAVPV